MSVQMTISDQKIVCRTCLKLLENTCYTYLDDENGYITNVGNIREMLQFCIPELDLHVSADPIICHQCLPILVQVYNFKIKCVNGESMIRSYITKNNLQNDNHVNLNCVVMEELIQNQKAQLESRIKHLIVQESKPPTNNTSKDGFVDTIPLIDKPVVKIEHGILDNDQNNENTSDNMIFYTNVNAKPEYSVKNVIKYDNDVSLLNDPNTETKEEPQDQLNELINKSNKIHKKIVVRKDLFDMSISKKKKASMLNNSVIPKNGRLIIKIDRKRLQRFNDYSVDRESNTPSDSSSLETDVNKTLLENCEQNSEDSSPEIYTCNKCSFITHDMIKMYDHNRTFHNFDYTCQYCPFSTSKVELLGKHMSMVHPNDMAGQRSYKITQNFACTLCPFSVKTVELLRSHHLSAHNNKNLNNDNNEPIILNASFRNKSNLLHKPKILRPTKYICDVCNYSTKDKSNLRKHLFTHGTKHLKCNLCSYKYVLRYQLRRHLKEKHAVYI